MLREADKAAEFFAKNLDRVLEDLSSDVSALVGQAKKSRNIFDAAALLENREGFLQALEDSGYVDLADAHVKKYPNIIKEVQDDLKDVGIPAANLTKVNTANLAKIAEADFEGFMVIGEKAMDDLRRGLFDRAIRSEPMSKMTALIRESIVGVDKKGSPLSRYAKTYANTAALHFNGEVLREIGESLGAEKWEVVGPLDDVTRDECRDALMDPVRTTEEWQDVDYWGGAPGGWNCRHQLYPVKP